MTILLDPINRKPIYERSPFLIRDMIWLSGSEGPHCVRDGRQGDNQPTVNDNRIAMDKERKTRATDPFILSRTNPPGTSSSYQSTTLFGHFPSNQSTNGFPTRGITSDGCPIFECRLFSSALFSPSSRSQKEIAFRELPAKIFRLAPQMIKPQQWKTHWISAGAVNQGAEEFFTPPSHDLLNPEMKWSGITATSINDGPR